MPGEQHKILVVDDLPDWQATLGGLLTDAGYQVRTTGSFDDALKILESDHFDLAVLDMRLDESDEGNAEGLVLAARIKERWSATKVVIITGYGTPERLDQALQPDLYGQKLTEDFISKTEAENLVQVVRDILGK